MVEPVTIGIGANKWIKDTNTKMITLFFPIDGTGIYSLHDDTNVDYVVPSGKKLVILKIQDNVGSRSNGATCRLYKNITTDTTTGGTMFYTGTGNTPNYSSSIAGTSSSFYGKEVYYEIPSGDYIIGHTSGSSGNTSIIITGVETDV